MTIKDYFGNWTNVLDREEFNNIIKWLKTVNPNVLCPSLPNIFKAFNLCDYNNLKVVALGQDPYPQKGVATGILFGNNADTQDNNISPSLKVIKECVINFEIPHNIITFDNTLESWAKQGMLMLNSALTCNVGAPGSHINKWRPFISKMLRNLSKERTGLVYMLFGNQAKTFKPYINATYNDIIEVEHPAYFTRTNTKMPYRVFKEMNNTLYAKYGEKINLFNEL